MQQASRRAFSAVAIDDADCFSALARLAGWRTSPRCRQAESGLDPSRPAATEAARRKQMREKNATLRAKRDACLQERKEKKIPILGAPAIHPRLHGAANS